MAHVWVRAAVVGPAPMAESHLTGGDDTGQDAGQDRAAGHEPDLAVVAPAGGTLVDRRADVLPGGDATGQHVQVGPAGAVSPVRDEWASLEQLLNVHHLAREELCDGEPDNVRGRTDVANEPADLRTGQAAEVPAPCHCGHNNWRVCPPLGSVMRAASRVLLPGAP